VIACAGECIPEASEALLRPVISGGKLLERLPSAAEARDYCLEAVKRIKPGHRVEYSAELLAVAEAHNKRYENPVR
jgi:hypothetical protein